MKKGHNISEISNLNNLFSLSVYLGHSRHAFIHIHLNLSSCLVGLTRGRGQLALGCLQGSPHSVTIDITDTADLLSEDLDGGISVNGGSATADEELLDVTSLSSHRHNTGKKDSDGGNVVGQDTKVTWGDDET